MARQLERLPLDEVRNESAGTNATNRRRQQAAGPRQTHARCAPRAGLLAANTATPAPPGGGPERRLGQRLSAGRSPFAMPSAVARTKVGPSWRAVCGWRRRARGKSGPAAYPSLRSSRMGFLRGMRHLLRSAVLPPLAAKTCATAPLLSAARLLTQRAVFSRAPPFLPSQGACMPTAPSLSREAALEELEIKLT